MSFCFFLHEILETWLNKEEGKEKATPLIEKLSRYELHEFYGSINELHKEEYVSQWGRAMIYIELGDNDQAIEFLEKAYLYREGLLMITLNGPWYDKIRSDPRFKALLKKMNLE